MSKSQEPRSAGGSAHAALNCTANGLSLGDVPLLQKTAVGLQPRPADQLGSLLKAAYGGQIAPEDIMGGLNVIAEALNTGELGKAMIAAIHLRLPALPENGAIGVKFAEEMLTKYNPDEPRDSAGRWTTGGLSSPHPANPDRIKPILVGNGPPANDNMTPRACYAATKQCQTSALADKSRTNYFDKCWEAEDVCLLVLGISRADPNRLYGVVYPDGTVIQVEAGIAKVTHIGRVKLPQPLI